jgi:hypothetical protein
MTKRLDSVVSKLKFVWFKWFKAFYLSGYYWAMRKREERYHKRMDEK